MTEQEQQQEIERLRKELARTKQLNQNLSDLREKEEIEEKRKKNLNFVQLYKKELMELRALNAKDPNALTILLIMVEKMNKQNALMISQNNLIKILKKSRPTVSRAIAALKESKFLDVIKVGTANAYIINSNVFWQDNALLKDKAAIFTATVIASGDEQDKKYFENWENVKLKQLPLLMDDDMPSILGDKTEEQKGE